MPELPKQTLHRYLRIVRDAMLWKLEGLSEYDVRRPLTPTGTNLLGLVKHLASVEVGYFGDTFGRPFGEALPWWDDDAEDNADLWATADEPREDILGLYRRAWAHGDAPIAALHLDSVGHVPWWPPDRNEVTLHQILVHVLTETNRHVWHADIVEERLDGAAGLRVERNNPPAHDEAWWAGLRARIEQAATTAEDAA